MLSLYIVISHKKLLKKSSSINEGELVNSLSEVIDRRGGYVSDFSSYLSCFPSRYEYSLINFIHCLQEVYEVLSSNIDLVGYNIIVDNVRPDSDFEYLEKRAHLSIMTNRINRVWFTPDSFKILSKYISGKKHKKLILIDNTFMDFKINNMEINHEIIDSYFQNNFSFKNSNLYITNSEFNNQIYTNLVYWSRNNSIDKIFYINLNGSCDYFLSFIDFLITLKPIFDPSVDLDDDEIIHWGMYKDLFIKFNQRSYDCFILDDAVIHFNKLILLWVESFSKRYRVMFTLQIDKEDNFFRELCTLLSLINRVFITIFTNESRSFTTPLPIIKNSTFSSSFIYDQLKDKSYESLQLLYIILITKGVILTSDILLICKGLGYEIITLREELEKYKRDGLLIGENNLYPGYNNLLEVVSKLKNSEIKLWRDNFLGTFFNLGYDKIFSYSYIISLIGLNSTYKFQVTDLLYNFIQKVLDLGLLIKLSDKIVDKATDNSNLKSILEYKNIRESRLERVIKDVQFGNNINKDDKYYLSLEYLDVLNSWSTNSDERLISRCKELYYNYQIRSEPYNESRAKIIFALSLIGIGSINESVDYFDLNFNYSKNIDDTYSYIRNGCFLSMALFVKGDISGVLRVSKILLEYSWVSFKTRWFLYLQFIRARALGELGYYQESIDLLNHGVILAKNFNYLDILGVLNNWKGKFLYYLGKEGEAREVLLTNVDSPECFFFLSELEYFSGNWDKAIEYIYLAEFKDEDKTIFDENLNWRDGYFLIEEFYDRSREHSILKSEINNFKYLLECVNGNKNFLKIYADKITNISNSSKGIYDYKYLYYLFLSLENVLEDYGVNRDNIYNKVIRLLQHRASKLSEHNQKHLYLGNYLNELILNDKRERKVF